MREWSYEEPAEWCQCTSVQLQKRGWGWVIPVDLEEAMPEEKTRNLPGLELNTAVERAYTISYSWPILFEIGSYLMAKKGILCTQQNTCPIPPLFSKWTLPILNMINFIINSFTPSMSGELCPSCSLHTLWLWWKVAHMSWADWSAELWRCKDFLIVWEKNTGLNHKTGVQQNETTEKHLRTSICEKCCLLQSLRKDLFISPGIIKQVTDFITPVTNLNINKSKMLRDNAHQLVSTDNWDLESLNSLTGTALLPWRNGCFMRNTMMPTEKAAAYLGLIEKRGCQFLSLLLLTEVCPLSHQNILLLNPL